MIKGTYIFYDDGKEICRSSNIITKFGKRFLTNFMAGNVSFAKKEIAIGISTSSEYALSDSNSRLGFEFYRMPVEFGSTNIQSDGSGGFTYSVIYKSTIPQEVAGIINEIGLYPLSSKSQNSYDSKFVSDFENNVIWNDSNGNSPSIVQSISSNNPRIGQYLMQVSASQSSSKEYMVNLNNFDISGYSVNDTLTLAYYQADSHISSIKIKFYSSDTDYYLATFTPNSTTGNKIIEISLSNMLLNPVGNPDGSSITKIGIQLTATSAGSSSIYLDGLRINDEDTFDPSYGLISRSIISGGLEKITGRQVDVEYRLELF